MMSGKMYLTPPQHQRRKRPRQPTFPSPLAGRMVFGVAHPLNPSARDFFNSFPFLVSQAPFPGNTGTSSLVSGLVLWATCLGCALSPFFKRSQLSPYFRNFMFLRATHSFSFRVPPF